MLSLSFSSRRESSTFALTALAAVKNRFKYNSRTVSTIRKFVIRESGRRPVDNLSRETSISRELCDPRCNFIVAASVNGRKGDGKGGIKRAGWGDELSKRRKKKKKKKK